jgi:hypothetical protein
MSKIFGGDKVVPMKRWEAKGISEVGPKEWYVLPQFFHEKGTASRMCSVRKQGARKTLTSWTFLLWVCLVSACENLIDLIFINFWRYKALIRHGQAA